MVLCFLVSSSVSRPAGEKLQIAAFYHGNIIIDANVMRRRSTWPALVRNRKSLLTQTQYKKGGGILEVLYCQIWQSDLHKKLF